MLIEVEGYQIQTFLSGKKCTEKELRRKCLETFEKAEGKSFVSLFCRMWGFEEYPYADDVKVNFIIDTDTHLVYKPRY